MDSMFSKLSRITECRTQESLENHCLSKFIKSYHHPCSRDGPLSSMDSRDDHDMKTEAKPTPRTVPVLLTGQPTQSREHPQSKDYMNNESQNNSPPSKRPLVQIPPLMLSHASQTDLLVGMINKQSTQTIMVRPISTTTLTFNGLSEKFDF